MHFFHIQTLLLPINTTIDVVPPQFHPQASRSKTQEFDSINSNNYNGTQTSLTDTNDTLLIALCTNELDINCVRHPHGNVHTVFRQKHVASYQQPVSYTNNTNVELNFGAKVAL